MENKKLGFIGAGNMAEAIIKGVASCNILPSENIYISDVNPCRLDFLKDKYNICTAANNNELMDNVEFVVFAVKPQVANDVLKQISQNQNLSEKKFVSIMAGKIIASVESILGDNISLVRVMPNTPALVGQGMSGLCRNNVIADDDFEFVCSVFDAIGKTVVVDEKLMDAVTAVSGSGPAYVYYMAELMISVAVKAGLAYDDAALMVKQTFLGASLMMQESGDAPEVLREKVSSPGGTTVAGLKVFMDAGLEEIVEGVVKAAKKRSVELSV